MAEDWIEVRSDQSVTINGVIADFGNETLRDRGGNPIELRPQAFAVLRYLAENADRLVTKDELIEAVWPSIAVTEDSLFQCIHEIRRALHDEARTILQTAPKRGYRLLLSVNGFAGSPVNQAKKDMDQHAADPARVAVEVPTAEAETPTRDTTLVWHQRGVIRAALALAIIAVLGVEVAIWHIRPLKGH